MSEPPQFSIVVTTRDRPRQLENLLSAVAALDFPRERFEVIVVDDGSSARIDSVFVPFAAKLCLKTIRQTAGGPARGRNTGVRAAQGRYVTFIDDDCIPETGWLRSMENAVLVNPGAMIGGRTVNGLPTNPYSTASQFIVDMVYAFYNQNPREGRFFATNNMALPRERFLALGGFDEDYLRSAGEDRDLCDRWRHAGFSIVYEQSAVVGHFHNLNLASFCRQHFAYGCEAALFHRKAAKRRSGHLRDHIGFHSRMPSWFVRAWRGQRERPKSAVKLILLFMAGQAVTAAGFIYGRLRPRRAFRAARRAG